MSIVQTICPSDESRDLSCHHNQRVTGLFEVGHVAVGHFSVGLFVVRTLRRKETSPYGYSTVMRTRRKDFLPCAFSLYGHFAIGRFAVRIFLCKKALVSLFSVTLYG